LTVEVYQILVDRGWRRYMPHSCTADATAANTAV